MGSIGGLLGATSYSNTNKILNLPSFTRLDGPSVHDCFCACYELHNELKHLLVDGETKDAQFAWFAFILIRPSWGQERFEISYAQRNWWSNDWYWH
jgi:hypothetical protein